MLTDKAEGGKGQQISYLDEAQGLTEHQDRVILVGLGIMQRSIQDNSKVGRNKHNGSDAEHCEMRETTPWRSIYHRINFCPIGFCSVRQHTRYFCARISTYR